MVLQVEIFRHPSKKPIQLMWLVLFTTIFVTEGHAGHFRQIYGKLSEGWQARRRTHRNPGTDEDDKVTVVVRVDELSWDDDVIRHMHFIRAFSACGCTFLLSHVHQSRDPA